MTEAWSSPVTAAALLLGEGRPWFVAPLLCGGAYALGSIPTGLWVARTRGVDIRRVGSGNIGATNVARALGRRSAIVVLVVDVLKGFLPVFLVARALPRWLGEANPALVAWVGLFAIVGHMFTFFLRGHGGKGVATSLGVAFGLSPPVALAALAIYVVTYALTRISSLGSLLGIWAFPVVALGAARLPQPYLALSLACAVLVTWRHRGNLRRLARGQEHRS
jgi:glycerol-3-phosphate acyltransferase PlsY